MLKVFLVHHAKFFLSIASMNSASSLLFLLNASDLDFGNSLSCNNFQYAGGVTHGFAFCSFSSRLIT